MKRTPRNGFLVLASVNSRVITGVWQHLLGATAVFSCATAQRQMCEIAN